MNILETHSLKKSFGGVHAVQNLSISIERESITGIIGPNGSGKSTLVNLLTGMLACDRGSITVSEVSFARIHASDVATYGLTRTFQEVRVFEQMSVLDNILVVLTERGVLASLFERHSALHLASAQTYLERVGLWDKRNALASTLSYGQRKLLEIARALAMQKTLIIFDEPFAGLFPEMVKTVVGIIKELKEHGTTIILIEHNMDIIRELSDHVIVLDAGTLLAQGKPNEVLAQKNVLEAYLGE